MTQKEQLRQAMRLATTAMSVARSLRRDASDYDCRFPIAHADRLEEAARAFLGK